MHVVFMQKMLLISYLMFQAQMLLIVSFAVSMPLKGQNWFDLVLLGLFICISGLSFCKQRLLYTSVHQNDTHQAM